jgi:ACS family D-galactonate transporter-like MFS transporter
MRTKVRYLILFILCAMYFIAYVDRVNISVAGPLLRKELGLTPTALGVIFSAFAYPYAAMQIVGGWLSDKWGPRVVLAILSVVWAAATILTGLSWSVASLVAFRVLVGLGEGGAFPAATRALSFWLPVGERGFAQGITHSFARLGGAVTPPIVLAIAAASGWRASFVALGIVSLLWTVVWLVFFRNTPAEHPWMTAAELVQIGVDTRSVFEKCEHAPSRPAPPAKNGQNSQGVPREARLLGAREPLLRRAPRSRQDAARTDTPWKDIVSRMWLVTLIDFCYGWSLWVFLAWLPSYLSDARGFSVNQLALMTTLPLLAGVVGDTLGGIASDAIFRWTGNLRLARCALLVVGLVGALVFILPAVMTNSPVRAVYYLALAFFFLELTNAVLWALPLDIAGKYAGTAGGIMNTGFGIAGMISPVVFGFLIERTGRYELPFFISAGLLLIGAVCSFGIDPAKKIQDPAALRTFT